jgi:HK97 family phage major capsid protein
MNKKFNEFLDSKGITTEDYKVKSAEDMAALYNEYNEKTISAIEELAKKGLEENKQALVKLNEELAANRIEQSKTLNASLKEYGLAIKKLAEGEVRTATHKSVNEQVYEQLTKGLPTLTSIKEGSKDSLTIKAAGTITSANISGGNVPVEQRIAGMSPLASRRIRLMDIVSRGVASSNIISWVSQAAKDGTAGVTGEGLAKNQIDFDLVVASQTLRKVTAYIKVSQEMLEDVDFINSEINNELMREVIKSIEAGVYEGAGTGITIKGIRTSATAFAAGTFALDVDNANFVDVLRVAVNQILIADQPAPNYILAHPSDVTNLKLIKNSATDKRYIDQLQLVGGTLSLDGIPIIESTLVTVDEYLVGSFDLATVWDRGSVQITVGMENDDFTKNLVTILAEWRGLCIVKTNDETAFVKGVISTDSAALETT